MRRVLLFSVTFMVHIVTFGASDYMKSYTADICGAVFMIELHPDMRQPAVIPRNVAKGEITNPGDISTFLRAAYEYRRAWHATSDGRVIVHAIASRRTDKEAVDGLSFFDIDQLLERMVNLGSDFQYEKVERNGRTWIKRTKVKDVPAGQGRTMEMQWLVPIQEDILIVVGVALHDYATKGSQRDLKWYRNAEAMQKRIFESVQVGAIRPPAGG